MQEVTKTAKFRDAAGREWKLAFNLGIVRDLRDTIGLDFAELQDGKGIIELGAHPEKFGALLWMLCEEQCDARKVDEISFMKSIDATILDDAVGAVLDAIVNFSQKHLRSAVKEIQTQTQNVQQMGVDTLRDWMKGGQATEVMKESMTERLEAFGKSLQN